MIVRTAKPEAKVCKLTDSEGMVLLVYSNSTKDWRFLYRFSCQESIELGKYSEISQRMPER
ncbi:Arm DNA-binding domain-containing protein [Pantoea vagans]|uniref:Arm DNA-binding domain-containing protein n=1 Tax=Pantoea vagans TaxID=470934 RepID=UPI0035183C95